MRHSSNEYAVLSLATTILTAILTSIHHSYEMGIHALILVVLFIILPSVFMAWFKKTESRGALWAYGLLDTWLVVGLGVVDGLWNHIIRPMGFSLHGLMALHGGAMGGSGSAATDAGGGSIVYTLTGALTFVAAMFAAYYGYRFIQTNRQSGTATDSNNE